MSGSFFATKLVKTGGILVPLAAKIWWCAKTGQNRRDFAMAAKISCLGVCLDVV